MANLQTKIERQNLAPRVQTLMKAGVVHGTQISAALKADGHDISPQAVNRFLAKMRDTSRPLAATIFEEHVQKEMPKDLEALEEMEAMCLVWAREAEQDIKQRVAQAAVDLPGEAERWKGLLKGMCSENPKESLAATQEAIATCLGYLTRDARFQDKRVQAINQAVKIIELKLRQAGVLQDDDRGRIIIMDPRDKDNPVLPTTNHKGAPTSSTKPYLVHASNG